LPWCTLAAELTEYGAPFRGTATVRVDMTRPDGSTTLVALHAVNGEPGRFEAHRVAAQSGIYRCYFVAAGRTVHEQKFTREALRTAAVWHGGDNPGTGVVPGGVEPGGTGTGGGTGPGGEGRPGGDTGPGSGRPGGVDLDRLCRCLVSYCARRPDRCGDRCGCRRPR
jgi:hypothetical protein